MTYAGDERSPPLERLPPGQQAILASFKKHGPTSIYVASDIMDLRVCGAMAEKGLLKRWEEPATFELTPYGVRAMEQMR